MASAPDGNATRIIRDKEGHVIVVPPGAKFEMQEGMTEVNGVMSVDIQIRPNECVTAVLEIQSMFNEALTDPRFMIRDPLTDQLLEVEHVLFKDGSEWST